MYRLEAVYGPRTYKTFGREKTFNGKLTSTRQSWKQVSKEPLAARSYADLVDIVSFLSVMNKRDTLYFRGQTKDWGPLQPAIFRSIWTSLSGTRHVIPKDPAVLQQIWDHLNVEIKTLIRSVCDKLPMPRPSTLRMFREAAWAIAQHYELWPTPLIDITPSLRTAASFALWDGQKEGFVYVVALPPSTNSVTFDADQHVVLARLQAVCPPVAKRPHFQEGFLAGRFPFASPLKNCIDEDPAKLSDLTRRLVARIDLTDSDDENSRQARRPSGHGFWSDDFPRMSREALLPKADDDHLLKSFAGYAAEIDQAMHRICHAQAA
jgi:hypothetical protein